MSSTIRRGGIAFAIAALGAALLAMPSAGARTTRRPDAVTHGKNVLRIYAGRQGQAPPTTADCEQQFGIACYAPFQFQKAYDLNPLYANNVDGSGATIAIVDSFGSPTIQNDVDTFDTAFGLPPVDLQVIYPVGDIPPFDPSDSVMVNWAVETSLDVEYAHAMAPGAKILLVETPVAETEGITGFPPMIQAENYVIKNHMADVISQSFGATEETFPNDASLQALRTAYQNAQKNDITVVASTGDQGVANFENDLSTFYPFKTVVWSASDPLVTAVGGLQLHLDAAGNRTAPDNVWNDSYNPNVNGGTVQPIAGGGGVSNVFARPSFQDSVKRVVGFQRGIPDISLSAAVDGGAIVRLGVPGVPAGYYIVGGTSEAAPQFAGVVALADQAAGHALGRLNGTLYKLAKAGAPGIVDITRGSNTVTFTQGGHTTTLQGYQAVAGYDLSSGLGTIDGAKFVMELAGS